MAFEGSKGTGGVPPPPSFAKVEIKNGFATVPDKNFVIPDRHRHSGLDPESHWLTAVQSGAFRRPPG